VSWLSFFAGVVATIAVQAAVIRYVLYVWSPAGQKRQARKDAERHFSTEEGRKEYQRLYGRLPEFPLREYL
jgi:hypothetical protein